MPGRVIKSVGFLLIPDFALLSYAAAIEPLRAANLLAGKTLYGWRNASVGDRPAPASNGLTVLPDFKLGSDPGTLDLMLVCAGGNPTTFNDKRTFAWLRRLAARGVTLGGISGGPLILAKAGLLSGRRCTVHWLHAPAMAETFPDVEVTRSLFEIDRDRITCSGGVASLDMMVALITRDHGFKLGSAVSEWLLHTNVREGAGPQRMDLRHRLGTGDERLLRAVRAMESNLENPLTRGQLADFAGLSLRQLERSFQKELGRGVHEHYLVLRLAQARQFLQETSISIFGVALATGFASATQFSRAFKRHFGIGPRDLRQSGCQRSR
jgi:transcriptional regulator GlxA family with amidase domain